MPAAGAEEFDARMAELSAEIGHGVLAGDLDRDQVYAQYQHETPGLDHPVGDWKYQETALLTGHRDYLQTVADAVLEPGGPARGMAEAMEALDGDSGRLTPKDLTILAHSGHPRVVDDDQVVYDRAPEVPRLSDRELADLHRKVTGITNRPETGG